VTSGAHGGRYLCALALAATLLGSGKSAPRAAIDLGQACRSSTGLSFVSTRNKGNTQVYALDVRRPRLVRRITQLAGMVGDPAWSPDGRRLAFRWFRPATKRVGVFIANADGSNVRQLVDQAATPDWSPDGKLIAYANLKPAERGISTVNVERALAGDHSATRVLTRTNNPDVPEEIPKWSPDGRRLLFSSNRRPSFDIWVVDADGRNLRDLTPRSSLEYVASWSPTGARIVFGSNRAAKSESGGDLYSIRFDGTGLLRLTRGSGNFGPAWSPDGRWIAFTSNRSGNTEIYLMRPNGKGQRRLTRHKGEDLGAAWIGNCRTRA
jgi:TolB protein